MLSAEHLAARGRQAPPAPLLHDFQPDRVADEPADMMGFDVMGHGDDLMGLRPKATPTILVRAVIDLAITPPSARASAPNAVVEID